MGLVATAPGKLILSGEYAVLDGAPAVVVAVTRRVIARLGTGERPPGDSEFLDEVTRELARRFGEHDPAVHAARRVVADSSAFYSASDPTAKLGLGSSAAVTVAAVARALTERSSLLDREEVLAIALAVHAEAQAVRGARGSGADIAAAVHGGTSVVSRAGDTIAVTRKRWPAEVVLLPFFTGVSADTATLVRRVAAARLANRELVDAALAAVADASAALAAALAAPALLAPTAVIAAVRLAAAATDQLAAGTGVPLVPACVTAARVALAPYGGTAKTTGAGGGDVGVAVLPATADVTAATRAVIEAGCQPLTLSLDETGVDTRPG